MQASKERTSFFSLPCELRDLIYELAATPRAAEFRKNFHRASGLLRASKRLREEFVPLYYRRKLVVYAASDLYGDDGDPGEKSELKQWLRHIEKEQAASIKQVELIFYGTTRKDLLHLVYDLLNPGDNDDDDDSNCSDYPVVWNRRRSHPGSFTKP